MKRFLADKPVSATTHSATTLSPRWLVKSVSLIAILQPVVQRGLFGDWPTLPSWALTVFCAALLLSLIAWTAGGFEKRD